MKKTSPDLFVYKVPHKLIPFFTAALSLLFTVVSAVYINSRAVDRDYLRFQRAATQVENEIITRMDTYITLLRGSAGLFAANDVITYPQFADYVKRLEVEKNYSGIQGIGYSQRVFPGEADLLVESMRQQEFTDFQIRPPGEFGEEMHTILYLEPANERNNLAIGFDMYTQPTRRAAMDQARDTGREAMSNRVHLIQETETNSQNGFLIYAPIYFGGGVPETVEQRRELLRGYVYQPFRVKDLFTNIFGEEYGLGADFKLYDGDTTDGKSLLFDSRDVYPEGSTTTPRFTYTKALNLAHNTWTITYMARPEIMVSSERNLVPLILAVGAMVSLLFYYMTSKLYESDRQARKAAQQLRYSEQMTQFLADAGKIVISNRTEKEVLEDLAKLSVKSFCDWCIWDMKMKENFYCIHRDRKKISVLKKGCNTLLEDFKRFGNSKSGIVIDSEQIVGVEKIQQYLREIVDEKKQKDIQLLGLSSMILIPVVLKDEVIGLLCFVRSTTSPTFTKSDLGTARELSHRMSDAIEKIYSYRRVQEALRIRDEFLSIASHELKTPITSLNIYLDLLKKQFVKELSKMQLTYISKARSQADKLTNLINDLLDISKIERGKIEYRDEEFDMVTVVKEVADSIKKAHPTHAIIINGQITREFTGDRDRISQVLINLLNNAIKYSPQADRVIVSLSQSRDDIVIRIQDFGIGIDKKHHKKIFSRFYRAGTGEEAANFPGLGIGLYVSHQIVHRHNGTIEVESTAGEGSTFVVTLPFRKE